MSSNTAQQFVLGSKYRIIYGTSGSLLLDRNYGIYRFEGAVSCRLYFNDKNGVSLSIPKTEGEIAPVDGWVIIPIDD